MQTEGMGAVGTCLCLRCGHRQPHEPGIPCRSASCPRCGAALIREGSAHHEAYLRKRAGKKPAESEPAGD